MSVLPVRDATGATDNLPSLVDPSGSLLMIGSKDSTLNTYILALTAVTDVASAATDFLTIGGSASGQVRVKRMRVSGFSTAPASVSVGLFKRSTANSGGTSTTPVAASMQSSQTASVAVLTRYTVNPTTGTGVLAGAQYLNLGLTGAAGSVEWTFGDGQKACVLDGVAQSLAISFGAATLPAGDTYDVEVEWTEIV